MYKLKDEELKKIDGGAINIGAASLIIGSITMLIGVIDGFLRPMGCRE